MTDNFFRGTTRQFMPGAVAVGTGIKALAWQVRSGKLALENGRVELHIPSLRTANALALAVVQSRCHEINQILDRDGLHPQTLDELTTIFNHLANDE